MVKGVTRHCLTSPSCLRPRWRCCACRGASSSSSTPPSAPCRCTWRPCWRRPACMRPPCRPSGWWPSWTTSASSRSRWRSWRPCRWTRPSTPASSPSSSSPLVSCESSMVWHRSGLLVFFPVVAWIRLYFYAGKFVLVAVFIAELSASSSKLKLKPFVAQDLDF